MGEHLLVGRIGRAHGIHGEVAVVVRTDAPDARFAPGSRLHTEPASAGPLAVESTRWHGGRLLVRFAGVVDRNRAEALRGVQLVIDAGDAGPAGAPGEDVWWDHELIGLSAATPAGEALGTIEDVLHTPAGDLLAIRRPQGSELLVPFVAAMVPVVDVRGGRLVIDPPPGLLDL